MGLIVNNFETAQGWVLTDGYYRLDNINWDITNGVLYAVLHLYVSKEAAENGKSFIPTETISYEFNVAETSKDIVSACYNYIINIIDTYVKIEAAIAAYEVDENNYTIEYGENEEETGRQLIPNEELYSQRITLPSGFEKLLNASLEEE